MKLALVTDAIYPYHKGGKETRTHELSRRLARAGFDVHVYTMKWWDGSEKVRRENGVTLHAISRRWPLYTGERRSMVQGVMFGLSCFRLLWADFDVADVDHMPYFPLFSMRIVCWVRRKPLVATWHEVWGMGYWRQYLGRVGGTVAGLLERLTVVMPDVIVAVSDQTAADVVTKLHARRPVSLARNGVDAAAIARLAPAETRHDIVFVGRLMAHKRVDDLLRAVAILKRMRPNVSALIMSDGPERTRLEALAAELGVTGNATFTGFVERDVDKLRLMKGSKVFVLPSVREGFSFVTLEALACGLPVVTTNHPGNAARHLVTPATGRVVVAQDPAALAAAIGELLAANEPATEVMATARQYDWRRTTRTLTEVYGR